MVPDFVPLYAVVIVIFSLVYFGFSSIAFLFVRLEIPDVARLFRGLFNVYFWMVTATGLLAAAAFAASGRLPFMVGMVLLAAGAFAMRRWILPRIDAHRDAVQAGDGMAVRRLRAVHWGGMAANAAVLASVVSSVPYIL